MLDPDVWGRGYATEAAAAALQHGFEELGFDRIVSIIHPQNDRSIRVAGRLGLAPRRTVAWDDRGIDLEVYAIESSDWSPLQSPG